MAEATTAKDDPKIGDNAAPLARLSVDGGAMQNDLLTQFQADLLGRPVHRLKVLELSAFGAGVLAGTASRLMEEAKIEALVNDASDQIDPRLDPETRNVKIGAWKAAVNSVISRQR